MSNNSFLSYRSFLGCLDHPQRHHARQNIGNERGGYQQQSDEQAIKGRDASHHDAAYGHNRADGPQHLPPHSL